MKVLLLSDTHSPHTQKWALGLADKGIRVGLFSFNKAADEWYNHERITLFFEPDSPVNADSTFTKLNYLRHVRALRKIVRQFEPDILHAHYATSYGLIGALSGFKPYVLSVWGSDVYNFPTRSRLHRQVLQFNIRKANVILSTSQIMRQEISKYTRKKVEVIPFGVDVEKFSRNEAAHPSDGFIHVGTIKPLREKYGISYIIQAARILQERNELERFRFHLVGAGDTTAYEEMIRSADLEKYVKIVGRVPFSEVSRYHNMLDIFLNVSVEDSESFGVATVEAMACEKPVIVTDVGGLKEVVNNGEFGTIVPRKNAGAIADAILKIAAEPERSRALGKLAREHVLRNYDWEHNLVHMKEVYESLAGSKSLA